MINDKPTFRLSQISEHNLHHVHPDLVLIVRRALTLSHIDFRVIEGIRTPERQRQMVLNGHSKTMNSRHLTGHAVDLAPMVNNRIPWDDWHAFAHVAKAMKQAAKAMELPLQWGGDWKNFRDGPHFELPRECYP
ncbi:D-alanyl-D-alanine carboxypeptidase family protein [Yersinia pseudotuberculosis IP 32953]|uniref:Putative phage-related protein n=1 Tax=Yersinia pseudotuberculosis serotype I (strain IP32953) TaxID=273123 RepID=Q665G3_YERPS|nr:M15 family metallopeptidase [Yersinia pseudotuberculosis]AJJ02595.1 D-alanyl-D-alanine carboxypeptidase family protein [Yersinia pseudotuberculosis]AJJ55872.1 D-alanyl-D-alanine carboxypeptidase family protein [Yersinia pseudotuberculosis IP 32953]AJJ67857.1 D-alanyl-D-alanine carboxypeptidase family protein [Yersinia pseudotuberculosis PB1/+]AJJ70499.1 D-alanyl-D-alanine carboxypeptidase family protein [Yersinia pseudotuberculosis]AYW96012.1 M15 family peptidase [Yersinia pseudotuberculosi